MNKDAVPTCLATQWSKWTACKYQNITARGKVIGAHKQQALMGCVKLRTRTKVQVHRRSDRRGGWNVTTSIM